LHIAAVDLANPRNLSVVGEYFIINAAIAPRTASAGSDSARCASAFRILFGLPFAGRMQLFFIRVVSSAISVLSLGRISIRNEKLRLLLPSTLAPTSFCRSCSENRRAHQNSGVQLASHRVPINPVALYPKRPGDLVRFDFELYKFANKPASSGLLIVLNPASYQFNLVPVPKRNHVFIMSATEIAEDKNESRFERWWIIDASLEIGVGPKCNGQSHPDP